MLTKLQGLILFIIKEIIPLTACAERGLNSLAWYKAEGCIEEPLVATSLLAWFGNARLYDTIRI
jgi:hypothetical protein